MKKACGHASTRAAEQTGARESASGSLEPAVMGVGLRRREKSGARLRRPVLDTTERCGAREFASGGGAPRESKK